MTAKYPLRMSTKCVESNEVILENIQHALTLGLPELHPLPIAHDGNFVLVGSGPSVAGEVESIKRQKELGRPIIAIKQAHDWLLEHDIRPDMCVMLDPKERVIKRCIKEPVKGVNYMIASQSAPAMWEHLKGQNVTVWHAWSLIGEDHYLQGKMMVGGGTTTGLRAFNIGYLLGFRRFHIYGFDSCCPSKDGPKRVSGDMPERIVEIWAGKRKFYCNPAMAAQANEFQRMIAMFAGNIRMKAYGDGLIQEMLKMRKEMGHDELLEDELTEAANAN